MDAGEAIAVKFTNTKRSSITVTKEAVGGDDAFSFTGIAPVQWPETCGLGSFTLSNGQSESCSDLGPGTYTITEADLAGWDLTDLVIDDPDGGSSVDLASKTATIDLDAGEAIAVKFTNTKRSSITVTKEAVGGDGTFSFTGIAPATTPWPATCGLASFTLSNGQSASCSELGPGSYTITEADLAGWDLTDLVIDDPDGGSSVDLASKTATIDLDAGEAIAVKFTNQKEQEVCTLELSKTALNTTVTRGEDIYYVIKLCNNCTGVVYRNVTLWDVLPAGVELVSVYPQPTSSTPTTLTWFFGEFGTGCFEVEIVVRVPIVDINYDMEQGVQGEGFVNVHNDYDTHQGPESVKNCAYAKADYVATISFCATTGIVDPGTELKRRESGSGTYESDEVTAMRTENKSIHTAASLSAVYRPTTFNLPSGRSITYGSKWTDKSKAINTITGATMNEEYTHATSIDRDRSVDIDDNGTTMKTEVTFEGSGHIGVLKKEEPDSHPKVTPAYEATEDYVGRFNVTETADEYGSGVRSNKSVTGYGYTAVDKRVSDSQRTYESGTGSYESDEIIDTSVNYIAKDINLVHGPTSYDYTPDVTVSQDMKWNEGMWSKSGKLMGGELLAGNRSCPVRPVQTYDCNKSIPAVSYIGERYSSLDYLKKETEAIGLNEMNTNASFSGMAQYKVKATDTNRTGKIDNEELYVGQYGITRKVRLGGVSKYDRPHITVTKEGNLTEDHMAEYVIYIENDGTTTLSPVNIRDMLPPGTEYITSSMRPSSLTDGEVSWSVPALGVGSSLEIELELNITEFAPDDIVNRVQVCGMDGTECISAAAYSAIESGALPCCPPEVFVDKMARLDASDPTLVHYAIMVKNNANSTIVATVTDRMPTGLTLLGASPEPNSLGGLLLQWVLLDIQPGEVRSIEYDARANTDGNYVNSVQVDATSVDGRGYKTAEAAAQVQVSTTAIAPRTTRYGGWQPPNWNMTSPDEGITIELSPDEDIVEG
ncbi:MAG TPA: hypothetical protein P5051_05910 [Methanothrix sp.]|nr:hypothetical protein [Methanothrix sp.]